MQKVEFSVKGAKFYAEGVNFHEKAQITDALSDVNGSICDEKGNNHDQVEKGRLFVRMMGPLIDNEAAQQVD